MLLVSLKAAALGLNLTAANHVVLLDLWWNPTTEEQAIDRAHRIGQARAVHVTRVTIEGARPSHHRDCMAPSVICAMQIMSSAVSSAHRIGQAHNVCWTHDEIFRQLLTVLASSNLFTFACAGTVEDKILQLQERKRAMAETALGDGVGGLRAAAGRLTMQDLQFLFSGM